MNGAGPLSAVEHPHSHGGPSLDNPTLNVFLDLSALYSGFHRLLRAFAKPAVSGLWQCAVATATSLFQIWYFVTGCTPKP